MNRIRIDDGRRARLFTAPSGWNELTKRHLFAWCGILRQEMDLETAMDAAVMLLYGIPVGLLARLTPVQRLQLSESLAFLRGENRLTSNVIERITLLGRVYYGPAGRLGNLTIGEYRRTELYYQLWLETRDSELLRLLAATLFRPRGKGKADDIRQAVSEARIQRRAGRFKLLHPNWLQAVLLFYEGCRASIIRLYPRVFVKSKTVEGEKIQPEKQRWKLVDLEGHILAYSGDKLGTFTETMEVNMHVFFKHMQQRLEEYERLKQKGTT